MPHRRQHLTPALKTAAIYAVFGGLWILLSDKFLGLFVTNLETYATIQTYKGWAYIVITAGLVFQLVSNYLRHEIAIQEKLKLSEERYEFAMEAAHIGTWDWDTQSGEVVFNTEYTKMLGYDVQSFPPIYDGWEALVHPDDKAVALKALNEYLDGNTPEYKMEFRMLTTQKQWKWILARGKAFRWDENGKPLRVVGTHIDLTDWKNVERELESAREVAVVADTVKSHFLVNMSNEVSAPLNEIMDTLTQLKDGDLSQEQASHVAAAENSGHKLLALLNDVLSLSEIENDAVTVCKEDMDITGIGETLARVFKTQLDAADVALTFTTDADFPRKVCGDQSKLRQILFNLVGNALKFTSGGEIIIEAYALENTRSPNDLALLFSVADSGKGMSQSQLENVFNPYSATSPGAGEQPGIGLGIVSRLIPLLGGTLCIDTVPGEGTNVVFTIIAHKTHDNG